MKIMRNSKSSNHRYVIFAHQSVKQQKISYQHKSILTAILPTHSNTSNVKIGKLSLFSTLRFVKWHFLSFVFKFFVPNLFLSLNSSNKPYCISVCYIKSVVYQEANEQMGLHTYATGGGINLLLFSVLYILLVKVILRFQVLILQRYAFFSIRRND